MISTPHRSTYANPMSLRHSSKWMRPALIVLAWLFVLVVEVGLLNSDYMHSQPYDVLVTDKMVVAGSKGRGQPYAVYKLDDGYVFDEPVSVATYSQLTVGQRYTMSFRPMDIKQTPIENLLYFFLPCILASVLIVSAFFGFVSKRILPRL